jgi:hypothetical protein
MVSPDAACVPYAKDDATEVANGIDDNCDGATLADEICDGVDNDGDGLVDEDLGSCLVRALFVPVCWQKTQEDLEAAVSRWQTFLEAKAGVTSCGTGALEGRKFWTETASPGLIGCGNQTSNERLKVLKDAGVPLQNFDIVAFVSEPSPGCIAGTAAPSQGLMTLETGGATPGYDGEYVVYAHEFGHFVGLGEEYRVDSGRPNTVDAAEGCDPAVCCTRPSSCPQVTTLMCDGNLSRKIEGWRWIKTSDGSVMLTGGVATSDGKLPFYVDPEHGDGSRCIMSNASAIGWDKATDPQSGAGSHRGFCWKCIRHWGNSQAPKCTDTFAGVKRRIEASGGIGPDMKMTLDYMDIREGRVPPAPPASGGELSVEVRNGAGTLVSSFSPHSQHSQPAPPSTALSFWHRAPVAASISGPLQFTLLKNGAPVSQVTGGGSAPIASASSVVAECGGPAGTKVALNGSASSDPDGDTLFFSWQA